MVQRTVRIRFAAVLLLIAFVATAAVTAAFGSPSETINTNDRRPLAKVVSILEERYGVTIMYEDPPYLNGSQLADVTDAVTKTPTAEGRRILVPRGGAFAFTSTFESGEPLSRMRSVLEQLVTEYRTTGYGDFKVAQGGDVFHIVPRTFRNQHGDDESFAPILNTKITLERADRRPALEVLEETTAAVTRASSVPVMLGTVPLTLFANSVVTIRANNEPARSVLLRILAATETRLSWALYYSPDQPPSYFLNIHVVPSATK